MTATSLAPEIFGTPIRSSERVLRARDLERPAAINAGEVYNGMEMSCSRFSPRANACKNPIIVTNINHPLALSPNYF